MTTQTDYRAEVAEIDRQDLAMKQAIEAGVAESGATLTPQELNAIDSFIACNVAGDHNYGQDFTEEELATFRFVAGSLAEVPVLRKALVAFEMEHAITEQYTDDGPVSKALDGVIELLQPLSRNYDRRFQQAKG